MSVLDTLSDLDFQTASYETAEAQSLFRQLYAAAPQSILEICQDWGQLTLYLAAFLSEQRKGSLTTFHNSAGKSHDLVKKHVSALELDTRISPIQSGRSYTWAIQRLLNSGAISSYDVCVLNGKKSWDSTGFDAVLADMLLRPGGLLILSGTSWSMDKSPYFKARPHVTEKFEIDEVQSKPVQVVIDTVLRHLEYEIIDVPGCKTFGFARKTR